jgi:nitrogen fixation protein FixH
MTGEYAMPDRQVSYRWVPWAFAGALGVVVAVNGALAYFAVASSTGLVTEHPFDEGNGYNRVLEAGAAQDALGWHGLVRFADGGAGAGELNASFTDHDGHPLEHLTVTAHVVRPVEPLPPVVLSLSETAAGHYTGAALLPHPGQWEVRIAARQGDELYAFAQRIIVK